jgi:DNA-binding beta-propeller fold protein YncE
MKTPRFLSCCLAIQVSLFLPSMVRAAGPPLIAESPIVVPDTKGGFDFIQADSSRRRLLATHTGNGTLDLIDLDSRKILKNIPTGKGQGVAFDDAAGKYFVSVSKEQVLVIIDAATLAKTGEVKLGGEADVLTYDPKNHCAYVCHDHATELWVVDTQAAKLSATITLPGEPEDVFYDAASDQVFQNVATANSVAVIDPASNTVKQSWSTEPAKKPHGMAVDAKTHRLFSAGANGKLAVIDTTNGKSLPALDIAEGVDQIAIDPEMKRVYCASRKGVISVIEETAEGPVSLGDVKTATGARSIAVDTKTHAVWVAYADKEHSYVLRLHLPEGK